MSIARKHKTLTRLAPLLLALGVLLALFASRRLALAQGARPAAAEVQKKQGQIRVGLEGSAGQASIELLPGDRDFVGKFSIANTGQGPLRVRLAVRVAGGTPPGLGVELSGGGREAAIPPGQSRDAIVKWSPDGARAQQLYAHVLVDSDAVSAGAEPLRAAAIGVHASRGLGLGFLGEHVLSIMTFLPLLGLLAAGIAHLVGYKADRNLRSLTVALQAVNLALAVWLYARFDSSFTRADGNDGFQFVEHAPWIRSLGAEYHVGVDGVSVTMVLLTALIAFVGALASFSVEDRLKGYSALFNLLVTGMFGVFISLDLLLFAVFWEVMLLSMGFLIGMWGGPRRTDAARKFLLHALAGGVFMLLAFLWFHLHCDPSYLVDGAPVTRTFSIPELMRVAWLAREQTILGFMAVKVVWASLFVGFAILIPMVPFHTWLPDAQIEAPTAVSVLLAGVLLEAGAYGILRINLTLLPEVTQWAAPTMAVFGVVNILYGASRAVAQKDLKRLVAYASVSHMGFTLLAMAALTPQGIQAAIVQMFNHGLITAMLFTLVGVVHDRVHTRDLDKFGGLAQEMPLYTALVGFAFMASLGLPGLSGFWGEALTFIGAFPRYRALTMLATTGVIITAAYHLWTLQRMFLGKLREEWRQSPYLEASGGKFPEINGRELLSVAPLAVLVLVLGFWPRPLLSLIDRGALDLHRIVDKPGSTQIAEGLSSPPAVVARRGR